MIHAFKVHTFRLCLFVGSLFVAVAGVDAEGMGGQVAGQSFDAAPSGFAIAEADGTARGVRWAEPRKIRRVVLTFGQQATMTKAVKARLQYWHRLWDGKPDPILAEHGAGDVGWTQMDDWTNGTWKDADTKLEATGTKWTFVFEPTGRKEFEGLGEPGVRYRRTLMVRIKAEKPLPEDMRLRVLTDAVCRPMTARILLGKPAASGIKLPDTDDHGLVEVFNGQVTAVRAFGGVKVADGGRWTLPGGVQGSLEVDLLMAVDPANALYDRTVVTLRSEQRPFSFAADEVARGDRVLVDDLGVLVVRADDAIMLDGYRELRKEFPGKTVYDRVFDESEQTLKRAWLDMPLKRPLFFVHGLPGSRHPMAQESGGEIAISGRREWFKIPESDKDTHRRQWPGSTLKLSFGFPSCPHDTRKLPRNFLWPHSDHVSRRELADGYVPKLRTWWQEGPIHYEQTTILDRLDGGDIADVAFDDPSLLLMRIRLVNTSSTEKGTAKLFLTSWLHPGQKSEKLIVDGEQALSPQGNAKQLRYIIKTGGQGQMYQKGPGVRWTMELGPGQAHDIDVFIPSITLAGKEEIEALSKRDFDRDSERVCAFWKQLTARGTEIDTPEPWLNDFYKAHVRHMLVSCYKEGNTDRLHAHVGTFHYGVFPDESIMMISDLDRRGYHDEARRNLDSFLHYQGSKPMPGNYKTTDGLFYGAGDHDMGGYNKSHGWVLWGMAQHWWYTRDREWMERAAGKLVKGCDWVIRERQATMNKSADGRRPIEYGALPAGDLEDVDDYWYWLATNAPTWWGLSALADALADYGHPEASRLQAEAAAYRKDLVRAFTESRVRAPVVRVRDGTYVPKYPSRLYERGRSYGWLRETLEGSIHLLITEILDVDAPEAKWIINDFEDNLYISEKYGYSIPTFDQFWFSRGGFSMQPTLLGGPLPYLYRDEIKHFLRAFFNSFTAVFYPEIRMFNEHSLPELGIPFGDHFKPSDEAQATYWLRLMFISERGGDLYLGQAIPRPWLTHGRSVGIKRAATQFGPMSLGIKSDVKKGRIKATVTLGEWGYKPKTVYVRLRHPESKPIKSVTVNGQAYDNFDAAKEWVILPGTVQGVQEVEARY